MLSRITFADYFKLPHSCAIDTVCAATSMDMSLGCKTNPRLVGQCFKIHGRLSQGYVGPPSRKIWPIGTKRLLGVVESDNSTFGEDVDHFVYGDFEVCPFTPSQPNWMQFVCIESGSNLYVQKRP